MSAAQPAKGYVHVYTGDGTGKTTAAIGLAVRAAGAGLAVYIAQFMKRGEYAEVRALERLGGAVRLEQFGTGRFVRGAPDEAEREAGRRGLEAVRRVLRAGRHAVVVLDEANVAAACGILSEEELLDLIARRPGHVELVFTGRGAPAGLVAAADLVTEMRLVKHYFQQGVAARPGIEK
jgi:cob(I)alamin adenosyltransferase